MALSGNSNSVKWLSRFDGGGGNLLRQVVKYELGPRILLGPREQAQPRRNARGLAVHSRLVFREGKKDGDGSVALQEGGSGEASTKRQGAVLI